MPNRRRFRGPRRPQAGSPEGAASNEAAAQSHVPAEGAEAGQPGGRRRRRSRGGRGAGLPEGAVPLETAPGEMPADYIPLQVERGMPVLYEPAERAVEEF